MLFTVLGWLTGLAGPITSIVGKITDLQIAKVQASTDKERMAIDQQIQEAHDRKAVLIAEAGSRVASAINAGMRMFLAIGPATILLKLFLWDKVIGSFKGCANPAARAMEACATFRTDPLDKYQWGVITAVIAFYFVYDLAANSRK